MTYEEASSLPSACAMTHVGITAPRPALGYGWNTTRMSECCFAVLSEASTFCRAMAVTLSAATLPAVVEELLSEMEAAVRESARSTGRRECVAALWVVDLAPPVRKARVPDEHLLSLKFVFGSSAIQALDLVDRQSITLISSPSGRRVYQVLGSSGKTYTCLASCHYCSCPAFAFSVLRKSDSLLCKHLLAVYLSQVMRTYQQLSVSDKQLTDILLMEKKQEA
ncbi:zinc finger SWIM domain-containing protein 7 isoform X1 [Pteropus medius]|uniref:zinc finger SWIM domain-containing protein 7 isoform X1 n=1 Tax=Pteropus vampyrus TaxID=132908 RepID=UPI00196ACE75|nr:zinc finger SWIM domain-containing protein 7 isoform X1 [Pteropus giganteus]XP_039703401.1 zinc finger SWIM domain-containing protein 7 isoform X1 [Pteropus giganteus]XP_039703402.1 zinc finger SWIM domain-containing protein 7 isoform X1 [Pteropus giganteus]XP_039703404.1 zinc finger SWIM domain-containing protein 7 isoform X1 [Pteropus giganteus]XP_039703405.1 zinc finger SWIM domain-containing protein 7 isoform X1 [Pteropus giganteus]XP_039703406.1 zinc finger SWIM domain-containing prote